MPLCILFTAFFTKRRITTWLSLSLNQKRALKFDIPLILHPILLFFTSPSYSPLRKRNWRHLYRLFSRQFHIKIHTVSHILTITSALHRIQPGNRLAKMRFWNTFAVFCMLTLSVVIQFWSVQASQPNNAEDKEETLFVQSKSWTTPTFLSADLYACGACFYGHEFYECVRLVKAIYHVNDGFSHDKESIEELSQALFPHNARGAENLRCMKINAAKYGKYPPKPPRRPKKSKTPSPSVTPSATPSISSSATPLPSVTPSPSASATKLPLISPSSSPIVTPTSRPTDNLSVYLPNALPRVNLEIFRRDIQREVSARFNRPGDRVFTDADLVDSSARGFPLKQYPPYVWRGKHYPPHYWRTNINTWRVLQKLSNVLTVKQVVTTCGQSNCAAKVDIRSNRFIRREIVTKAIKKIQKSINFSSVFNPRSQKFKIIRRNLRLFTVTMPFQERYLQGFPWSFRSSTHLSQIRYDRVEK